MKLGPFVPISNNFALSAVIVTPHTDALVGKGKKFLASNSNINGKNTTGIWTHRLFL